MRVIYEAYHVHKCQDVRFDVAFLVEIDHGGVRHHQRFYEVFLADGPLVFRLHFLVFQSPHVGLFQLGYLYFV